MTLTKNHTCIPINEENVNIEIFAKIINSLIREYGCSAKFNRDTGKIDIIGEKDCISIVNEIIKDLIKQGE